MTTVLTSPAQASLIYGAGGSSVPRQRHVFMVRFIPGTGETLPFATYVIKHCDRPKINAKSEDLNQYNKKRQIYTGFKYDPLRMTFYDSADGSAQKLWTRYARYYFGDFIKDANNAYGYDVTTPFVGSNFGLSEGYAGNTDTSSQWFFNRIEIYQFYWHGNTHNFDSYFLYNPRITSYDPDDFDYENCSVAQISMTFVYENVQYDSGSVSNGQFEEFTNGLFWANPLTDSNSGLGSGVNGNSAATQTPVNPSMSDLLLRVKAATAATNAYRNITGDTTGALGMYGNYGYGSARPAALAPGGINSGLMTSISSGVGGVLSSPYGSIGNVLTTALLSTNGGQVNTTQGASLPSAAYGSINANQMGTAQYGFNTSSSPDINPVTYIASLASSNSSGTVNSAPLMI